MREIVAISEDLDVEAKKQEKKWSPVDVMFWKY